MPGNEEQEELKDELLQARAGESPLGPSGDMELGYRNFVQENPFPGWGIGLEESKGGN